MYFRIQIHLSIATEFIAMLPFYEPYRQCVRLTETIGCSMHNAGHDFPAVPAVDLTVKPPG